MIRRSEEKQSVRKPAPFNGVGEITVRSLLNGPEEMSQKGRVFGHTTVYPGSEIGYHIHTGDSETYYILSGKGLYNDNGTEATPAAVVYKATWPEQKTVHCTVGTLAASTRAAGITKIALIVVGDFLAAQYDRSKLYDPTFTTEYRKGAPQ